MTIDKLRLNIISTVAVMSNIAKDKLLHFFYGSALSFLTSVSIGSAFIIPVVVFFASLKEYVDYKFKTGVFSYMDIVFTVSPAIMFTASIYLELIK